MTRYPARTCGSDMQAYLLALALAISAASFGWGLYKDGVAARAIFAAAKSRSELQLCGARLGNILEDLGSDNEIDNLPDDALRDVPAHWLRPDLASPEG